MRYLGILALALLSAAPAAAAVTTDGASCSGTITAGGTAQQLFAANAVRSGWALQNQSTGNLYVRSRGSAGTTDATQDQNSLLVAPGAYWEPPYATPNAVSIVGATTSQAFWCRQW